MEKQNGNNVRILIIDDDRDVLNAARLLLKQYFRQIDVEPDPSGIRELLKQNEYDAVLLDMNFTGDYSSGEEGFKWMKIIKEIDPSLSVILITAYADVDKAVRAMKFGATDFVMKPWQNEKLKITVENAVRLTSSNRQINSLRATQSELGRQLDQNYQSMIGQSKSILKIFETIEKVAPTDANILILGENGTGKELVARALHKRSSRKEGVFINVDMGAIPDNLAESELFGHKKGSFTGAVADKPGRFEVAAGGTLFLDEIGNTPASLQPKLLSVLETGRMLKVGATHPVNIDVRLISATNSDLRTMVSESSFRQDLYYRINTIEIKLPPLRDRREDIPLLANHFLERFSSKYKKDVNGITKDAMKHLGEYHWPGNVRELQHVIERAVILSDRKELDTGDIMISEHQAGVSSVTQNSLKLDELEKQAVTEALNKHDGNISKASKELGLTRASLYRRMEKYGL